MGMMTISPGKVLLLWRGVGWFGLALLLYLSLMPRPPEIPLAEGDKLGHGLAYALLMFWWAQVYIAMRSRLGLAVGLMVLGIAIEYAQGGTGWRTFDSVDMLADAAGVLLGWLLAAASPNALALLGQCLKGKP